MGTKNLEFPVHFFSVPAMRPAPLALACESRRKGVSHSCVRSNSGGGDGGDSAGCAGLSCAQGKERGSAICSPAPPGPSQPRPRAASAPLSALPGAACPSPPPSGSPRTYPSRTGRRPALFLIGHFCSILRRFFAIFSVSTPGIQQAAPKDRVPVPQRSKTAAKRVVAAVL